MEDLKCGMNASEQIGRCCTSALYSEVCASPKPGLVDPLSSGSHQDMDYSTFIRSIAAISPYFSAAAAIGCRAKHIDGDTLCVLRPVGIECEKAMFDATGGVNTHKGAIFSLGIVAAAAGYCRRNLNDLSADAVCSAAGVIAGAAIKDFSFAADGEARTEGRRLYDCYGILGIRGEAASGFYSVRNYSLPIMRKLIAEGRHSENEICLDTLLHLMARVQDTNVIARCGIGAIGYVKSTAENALAMGGGLTPSGRQELLRMDGEYIKRNISPGGCADLLAVTVTLYLLENLL